MDILIWPAKTAALAFWPIPLGWLVASRSSRRVSLAVGFAAPLLILGGSYAVLRVGYALDPAWFNKSCLEQRDECATETTVLLLVLATVVYTFALEIGLLGGLLRRAHREGP